MLVDKNYQPDTDQDTDTWTETETETETEKETDGEESSSTKCPRLQDGNLRTESKHIVFFSKLLLLFQFCHAC